MLNTNKGLKNRDFYLDKLISFKDTEPVKVITGMTRACLIITERQSPQPRLFRHT